MQIDSLSIEDLPAGPLRRIESSFEALNARIARLAISLDVPLDQDQHIHEILKSPPPGDTIDSHHRRYWIELRGLLVLRYSMEKNIAEQIGAQTLKQILIDAEEHLSIEGFKPGADGMALHELVTKD